jgi:hypothetical protein
MAPAAPSDKTLVAALVSALAVVAGCSTDAATTTLVTPTSVGVDPVDFLGTVPCAPGAGAAHAYVVTLTDRTTGASLGASRPVSCAAPIAFENVVVGHTYSADIQVFDQDLATIDGSTTPRWTTSCASDGAGAAEVFSDQRTYVKNCIPLTGTGPGKTALSIDASALGAAVGCTADGGKIDKLSVALVSGKTTGTPPATQKIACGQAPVVLDDGIVPGQVYTLRVEAFETGATDPSYASGCAVVAKEGVTTTASCDALTDQGYVRIDAPKLVTDSLFSCGTTGLDQVATIDVTFDDAPSSVAAAGVSCTSSFSLGPFAAGSHAGQAFLRAPGGAQKGHALCFAAVKPASTVDATCVPD